MLRAWPEQFASPRGRPRHISAGDGQRPGEASMVQVDCVLDAKAKLGEAALWCEREQVLWWADIEARALHRFDPATGRDTGIDLPRRIGCFTLRSDSGFVVALEDGFF